MTRSIPLFLLLVSFGAHGAVNKWVDAQGNVHYSDTPPPQGVQAKTVNAPQAGKNATPQKSILDQEQQREQNQQAKDTDERKKAEQQDSEKTRQDACKSLLANRDMLKNSRFITVPGADGKTTLMNSDERKRQTEETDKQISDLNCDGQQQ